MARDRAEVAFLPVSLRFGTARRSTAFAILGARLRHICAPEARPPIRESPDLWLAEVDGYLREDRPDARPLLVVIDGADEAIDWEAGYDLPFPIQPGRGVKLLLSARLLSGDRDRTDWLRRLRWDERATRIIPLHPLTREGVAQVLEAMGHPLADLAARTDIVGQLHRLSQGDPLLVQLYVKALKGEGRQAAFLKPDDLARLRPGLKAYFETWFEAQDRAWRAQGKVPLRERDDVMAFFNILAVALGPLRREDVAEVAGPPLDRGYRIRQVAEEVRRFVLGDGEEQGYVFSHPRLGQHFWEQMLPKERRAWEERFLAYGKRVLEDLHAGRLHPRQAPPYVVQFYGAHLERARAPDGEIHALVSQGWLQAWEALEGAYSGFLNDVDRSWHRAERAMEVGKEIRCALCHSSVAALSANFPPELLARATQADLLTPRQALTFALSMPDEGARARALAALAPHLPQNLLPQALKAAGEIRWPLARVLALAALAPHLPHHLREQALQQAFKAAEAIEDADDRAQALAALAPHLPQSLREQALQQALQAAGKIRRPDARAQALAALAPYLPHDLLPQALKAAGEIERPDARVQALTALAPHLPQNLRKQALQQALQAAGEIERPDARAQALAALAPHLPHDLLPQAFKAAEAIEDADARAQALAALAPHLPQSLREQALQQALQTAEEIDDAHNRAKALTALAPHLPQSLREQALQQALQTAGKIKNAKARARALAALAPHLPQSLLPQASRSPRRLRTPMTVPRPWPPWPPTYPKTCGNKPFNRSYRPQGRLSGPLSVPSSWPTWPATCPMTCSNRPSRPPRRLRMPMPVPRPWPPWPPTCPKTCSPRPSRPSRKSNGPLPVPRPWPAWPPTCPMTCGNKPSNRPCRLPGRLDGLFPVPRP